MKKITLAIVSLGLFILVFLQYGRNSYVPMVKKIVSNETIASIKKKIETGVLERLSSVMDVQERSQLPKTLALVGLKEEQVLEVYALEGESTRLLRSYPFTGFSGELGPKLEQGDLQIPEGIYKVEYLNPNSAYYLSMKINYPNEFDIKKSKFSELKRMGDNIFIHGKSTTVGCIPIGDEAIEELFLLVEHALENEVKVIISPRDFRLGKVYPSIENIEWEEELYKEIEKELKSFPGA